AKRELRRSGESCTAPHPETPARSCRSVAANRRPGGGAPRRCGPTGHGGPLVPDFIGGAGGGGGGGGGLPGSGGEAGCPGGRGGKQWGRGRGEDRGDVGVDDGDGRWGQVEQRQPIGRPRLDQRLQRRIV